MSVAVEIPQPFRISNSKAKTFRRCERAYYYKYILGLKKRTPSLPLKLGDWMHQLLMVHYDGHDWKEHHRELTRGFNKLFDEEKEEYGDLPRQAGRMMISYVQHYHKEDRQYTVIDSEVDELIELPNGDLFNFIIDLIVEDRQGGLWLWDHKNTKSFMDPEFMLLDSQLARYFWAAKELGYKPLRGVLFNELITKPPTPPAKLKNGTLTKKQKMHCDVYTYYRTIKKHKLDPKDYADVLLRLKSQNDRFFRRTTLAKDGPLMKQMMMELMRTTEEIKAAHDAGEFPRTVDKSCSWGCDYLEPCIIQLNGGDIRDVVKLKYNTPEYEED